MKEQEVSKEQGKKEREKETDKIHKKNEGLRE